MINLRYKRIDRTCSTLAFLSLWSGIAGIAIGQPTNQVRYAIANKTEVLCGPGDDFYVTSLLKSGAAVDVFHHTKNGWCAIRPPDGSYNWLAAENAYLLPGGTVAEIVGNKVPAWIGSSMGSSRPFKWQVELQPTQQVRILGEAKQKIDQETERLWYRIAPPQGEFRWVRAEALSERAPIADPNDPPIEDLMATPSGRDLGMVRQASTQFNEDSGVMTAIAETSKSVLVESKPPNKKQSDRASSSSLENPVRTGESAQGNPNGNPIANKSLEQTGNSIQNRKALSSNSPPPRNPAGPKRTQSSGEASSPQESEAPRGLLTDFLARNKGGLSKKSPPVQKKGVQNDGVQQAQYLSGPATSQPKIIQQRTEPVQLNEGEYVVGSEEVVSDQIVSDGVAVTQSDQGHYFENGSDRVEEEYFEEGPVVSTGRSSIHLSHADDPSLHDWNALNSHPGRVLIRPLNGILGLIGFGIAESETIAPSHTSSHIIANSAPHIDPSMASRMDSLPRPTRRQKGNPLKSLLQPSQSGLGYQPDPLPRDFGGGSGLWGNNTDRNLNLERDLNVESRSMENRPMGRSVGDDWHARNRSVDTSQASYSTSTKSNESEPMQLSTPQLQEAFFELTKIVALPTDQWDFRQVHQYASDWVERGASVIERGEARLLQERIQQFESLRLKLNGNSIATLASSEPRSTNSYSNNVNQAAYSSPAGLASDEAGMSTAHQADASGKLSQVFTSRPGQPEFALTDANGGVVAYVVPTPGMNLRRYLDQPIAIYGTKGYLPELASKQIIADRVVRLR